MVEITPVAWSAKDLMSSPRRRGIQHLAGISFHEHPRSVNETYGQHLRSAWSFAGPMIYGGLACFVHGLLPFLATSTGSSIIRRLHDRMVTHRIRQSSDNALGLPVAVPHEQHSFAPAHSEG
jgi:hypothetical protein